MLKALDAMDWFLNTPEHYRANEPTKRDELLALALLEQT